MLPEPAPPRSPLVRAWRWLTRAFRPGPAIVPPGDAAWGHDPAPFTPRVYGDYLVRSPAVYACAALRARTLAAVPLRVYRADGTGAAARTPVPDGPVAELLARVNPHWTQARLLQMTELSLCVWGSAFWVLERGPLGTGLPTEIWWVRPDLMRIIPHPREYIAGYVLDTGGQRLAFLPGEVVWLRYPNPLDEFAGLSPLAAARLTVELGHEALRSNQSVFRNGLQIAGMLTPESREDRWSQETADALAELLTRRFAGTDRAHKIAILSHAARFLPVTLSPRDAQFVELMRWSLHDVCRVLHVPPELVADHEHATYSNVAQAMRALWTHAVIPDQELIAAEIREQLLPRFGRVAAGLDVRFDRGDVPELQEDRAALTRQLRTLWEMGVPLEALLQQYLPDLLPLPSPPEAPAPAPARAMRSGAAVPVAARNGAAPD